jgi:hypothetical protein
MAGQSPQVSQPPPPASHCRPLLPYSEGQCQRRVPSRLPVVRDLPEAAKKSQKNLLEFGAPVTVLCAYVQIIEKPQMNADSRRCSRLVRVPLSSSAVGPNRDAGEPDAGPCRPISLADGR